MKISIENLDDYIYARDMKLIKNPRDDFSCLFTFYVEDGPEFREKLKKDRNLREKYYFMKNKVFCGEEYERMNQEQISEVYDRFAKTNGLEKELAVIRKISKYRSN